MIDEENPERLRQAFVGAMARVVSSVTIVTTDGPAGRFGVTVSAMSSVSADPPLILACINRRSPACRAIAENRVFGVNVLASTQRHVAQTFAGRPERGRPFDFGCARWRVQITGAPILEGSVAAFDCRLLTAYDAGTHRIFIGEVLEATTAPGDPLLYGERRYGRRVALAGPEPTPQSG
ncbi:FMN reductase (NADH) RutF [bacterium HR40]|nr:FMN reductase (NADH) RutF [bacterium HR40]